MVSSGIGTPYWYEWEIGILECLRLLTEKDLESVTLQSEEFQKLDDVVLKYKDGSITNIQVKHTDDNNNFTYSFLSSAEESLLRGIAEEWQNKRKEYDIRQIQLATNKKWGPHKSDGKCSMRDFVNNVFPKLKENFSYEGKDETEKNAIEWFKNELAFSESDIQDFVKVFSFRAESDLSETENQIKERVKRIVGTDRKELIELCLNRLQAKLSIWATSRRKRQEIMREDIYAALCPKDDGIPKYELIPEKPIFPSRERFAKCFADVVKNTKKRMIFLSGMPGAGKTNFVSYFAQIEESLIDFRFYTYLPVAKDNASYSDDEGFYYGTVLWKSILTQLKIKFEEMKVLSEIEFPIIYQYMNVTEMRNCALKYMSIYAEKMEKECYFFIDGIDHVARSNDVRNSFLLQLPEPDEISESIKLILVGQPIFDKYPSWIAKNDLIEYITLSSLEEDDVISMLQYYDIPAVETKIGSLANSIISIVGNNALNLLFAIMELKKMEVSLSFEKIEETLREHQLNSQIDKYYEWILSSTNESVLLYKIETIFAFASIKIPLQHLAKLCNTNADEVYLLLGKLYPLIICDNDGYYAFHNDVRLHLKNSITANGNYGYVIRQIKTNIIGCQELQQYKYDLLFDFLYEDKDVDGLFELVNVEYVMQSVIYGIKLDKLTNQFRRVLRIIRDKQVYEHLPETSAVALALSRFASCINYYQKEKDHVSSYNPCNKTRSEKYILNLQKDYKQIINDIYELFQNGLFERGERVFLEHFSGRRYVDLFCKIADEKELSQKFGYICRISKIEAIKKTWEDYDNYVDFVDGWLDGSVRYLSSEELGKTFSFKLFNPISIKRFVETVLRNGNIGKETYELLEKLLVRDCVPISVVIDLGVYGLENEINTDKLIGYLKKNLKRLHDDSAIQYEKDKIVYYLKTWFCLYQCLEETDMRKNYQEILAELHIKEKDRGYKPAMAQFAMAKNIYEVFYNPDGKRLEEDTLYYLLFLEKVFGAGSCSDCDSYNVLTFLRKAFVHYARKHADSENVRSMSEFIIQSLSFEEPKYVAEFNELFVLTQSKDNFVKIVDYWCGEEGKAWDQEYCDVEYYCSTICQTLRLFDENEKANVIWETLRLRLFGYTGRKDYSLYVLLRFFNNIPLSEKKLTDYGMQLLRISNSASEIGDNRTDTSIDQELFDLAVKLGNRYANALFELKNTPNHLVYWRTKLLEAFYANIDSIDSDSELEALYRLTNAWINSSIEKNVEYGKIDTLREYNSIIMEKTNDERLKKLILENETSQTESKNVSSPMLTYEFNDIYRLLDEGYTEEFEDAVIGRINGQAGGALTLLLELKGRIPKKDLELFANHCVKRFIIKESKYNFLYSGVKEVLESYCLFFDKETWIIILDLILEKLTENDIDSISEVGDDVQIFTLCYSMQNAPDMMEKSFQEICDAHMRFVDSNGRIRKQEYNLNIINNINSIRDIVRFQLGDTK